ncbi:hypothetical protein BJ165DRAFT_1528842 [Panaeolus papilionaceus]|nr:hypothetical protein BJ165DRAFT_1528842 [Panaeolus papilionaceus]
MFKTAATKIAHNSTIPSLGGNQDLRPLQDLITAEKIVLISLQKLSVDYSKAAEALRTWGLSEGDDLGDILSASTNILNHFSTALSQYAGHGHTMRDQLKTIRTREEALDELKRRRRTVVRKADDAEKKLSKMSPEHKNLPMQTDLLHRLQAEIRQMDSEILIEEAALGDFKRNATRAFMGLKFGGLLECCEKGMIAAELGKHVVAEVPEEPTQPGLPRKAYQRINEVTMSTVPSVAFRDRQRMQPTQSGFPPPFGNQPPSTPWSPVDNKPQPPPPIMIDDDLRAPSRPYAGDLTSPPLGSASSLGTQSLGGRYQDPGSANIARGQVSAFSPPGHEHQTTDDFGVNVRGSSLESPTSGGGRFATFPVKMRTPGSAGGFTLSDPPSLSGRNEPEESFSASIAQALGSSSPLPAEPSHLQPSPAWDTQKGTPGPQGSIQGTEGTATATEDAPSRFKGGESTISSTFAPSLPPLVIDAPPESQITSAGAGSGSGSGLPPGAAPPDPWAQPKRDTPPEGLPANHNRQVSGNDALLAYMLTADDNDADDDLPSPAPTQTTIPIIDSRLQVEGETPEQRLSRHVRFGQVQDVDEEIEKRASLEQERKSQEGSTQSTQAPSSDPAGDMPERSLDNASASPKPDDTPSVKEESVKHAPEEPPSPPETDERALNAAAAREITLELEALQGNPPVPEKTFVPQPSPQQPQPVPPALRSGPPSRMNNFSASGYEENNSWREPSPLLPPQALFAKRTVSPHPYAELNANAAPNSQYSPQQQEPQAPYQPLPLYRQQQSPPALSAAQAYAQAYQNSSQNLHNSPQRQEYIPAANNLPPRLQALNNNPPDNPVPPRFQNLNGGRPGGNNVPPRFQTGGPAQVPATIAAEPDPTLSPPNADFSRPLGSLQFNRSNVSLNSGSSPISAPAPGTRTISAAAFKRPLRSATGDSTGNAPGPPFGEPFGRKALPASPREPLVGSPPSREQPIQPQQYGQPPSQYQQPPSQYQQPPSQYQQPPSQYQQQPSQYQQPPSQYQQPPSHYQQQPPQNRQQPPTYQQTPPQLQEPIQRQQQPHLQEPRPVSEFEEYDYISAYVNNSNPNSPLQGEFHAPGPNPPHNESGAGQQQRGYRDNQYGHDTDSGLR